MSEQAFIEEHRNLVRSVAQRLMQQYELRAEMEDLESAGFRGLIEAKRRFDPSRGVQFNTFAYYRIRGAVLDEIRRMAYVPRGLHRRAQAASGGDRLLEEVGRTRAANPRTRDDLDATVDALDSALSRLTTAWVLGAVGQADDVEDQTPEAAFFEHEEGARVREAVSGLPEREQALVAGFYFEGRRFDEVAAELGISKSWASRLHVKALELLRAALGGES